jgi:hypothetical protein
MSAKVIDNETFNVMRERRDQKVADSRELAKQRMADRTGFQGLKSLAPLEPLPPLDPNSVEEKEIEEIAVKLTENYMIGLFSLGYGMNEEMQRDLHMVKEATKALLYRRYGRPHFLQRITDQFHEPDPIIA